MDLFSANEWKKFALHFAYFVFQNIQEDVYLESFKKLSSTIMTLLGPKLRRSDVRRAKADLDDFVVEYEVSDIEVNCCNLFDRMCSVINFYLSHTKMKIGPIWEKEHDLYHTSTATSFKMCRMLWAFVDNLDVYL